MAALFRGRRQRFEYVVAEYEGGASHRAARRGREARSDDVIAVSGIDGRTRVAYEADLRLKGVHRVGEPFLRSTFRRMGPPDGLAATLTRAE